MTGQEIVNRAKLLARYKYWYGGKRELASQALADRLQRENPGVWTDSYYQTALKDINGKNRVCDCSGLVCYAYAIGDISSSNIAGKYMQWTGVPKAGMIGWKKGHVGIFSRDGWDAPIIEMRAQAYDYQCIRTYKECGFTKVLYSMSVDYDSTTQEASQTAPGWYSDDKGWWYRHTKGTGKDTYYHDTMEYIKGHWYFFGPDGYIYTPSGSKLVRVSGNSKEGWVV